MDEKTPAEYSFIRKNQAITLGTKSSVKIDRDQVQTDPQLLFQRLVTVVQSSGDLKSAFKYELCSYPSSLLLRKADKPALADAIWNLSKPHDPAEVSANGIQYVLDGGTLLQRIPWPRGST